MPVEMPLPVAKKPARWKMVVNLAILLALVGIFLRQAAKDWPAIQRYEWTPHPGPALLALALLLLCSGLDIFIWNRTLGWFARPLPFRVVAPVYIWSFIARYIPGKVGSLVLRVALAAQVDRAPVPVLASSAVELALRVASGLFIFVGMLIGWGAVVDPRLRMMVVIIIPLVLVCAHPRVMLPVMNWGLRKMKQATLDRPLAYHEVLGVFLALLGRWVVYGLAYALLAVAITSQAWAHFPALISTACGTWAAGFILMTPGGVGTSEVLQRTMLEHLGFLPAETVIIPVLARFGTLLCEGVWALACLALWRHRQHSRTVAATSTVPTSADSS